MLGLKDPTILDDIFHHTEKLTDKKEAPPQYTEAAGVSGSALKDVESTAKALEGVKFNANFNLPLEQTKSPKQRGCYLRSLPQSQSRW